MLFRDWVIAERRNTRLPLLSSQIDEIFGENSDDDMEAMEEEWQMQVSQKSEAMEEERKMQVPKNLSFQMIQNLQKDFKKCNC